MVSISIGFFFSLCCEHLQRVSVIAVHFFVCVVSICSMFVFGCVASICSTCSVKLIKMFS